MDYNSLIKDQTYLFELEEEASLADEEFICKIFENANLKKPNVIKLEQSNISYDQYNILCENESYILKFSINENDVLLQNEFNLIKNFNIKNTLRPISYNKFKIGDPIHYAIYLNENFESIRDFGLGILLNNLNEFYDSYSSLQKNIETLNSPKQSITNFIENNSIFLHDSGVCQAIARDIDFIKIEKIIESLKFEIFSLTELDFLNKNEFCHGNLNYDNILYCYDHYKFINLFESFSGNSYYDLATFVIANNVSDRTEKKLFKIFKKNKTSNSEIHEWEEYKKCYDLALRKIFLEYFFNYFNEIYIFGSLRKINIFNTVERICQNHEKFLEIPVIEENHKLIYPLFIEQLIGKK